MKTYRTAEIAAIAGVHPNTVRFYEERGLLPLIPRRGNGYRVYSERHLLQLRLIRLAFRAEILSDNLRNEAAGIVKTAAAGGRGGALRQTLAYQAHLGKEIEKAREAVRLTEQFLHGEHEDGKRAVTMNRREAAAQAGVSIHVLRDWERNGLITVPRQGNRRQYGAPEQNRMKIISILRSGGYSQMAIRRMLARLESGETDLLSAIDTPGPAEDIISVADRYITSLTGALGDVKEMLRLLETM